MDQGNIIYLNGTSSSGKSSIAKALQEILDGYYLHTGLDHFYQTLPSRLVVFSDDTNPPAADGFLWVLSEETKRTVDLRIGPVGWSYWIGMCRAYAALASAGNNLIVDDVIFHHRILWDAVDALYVFSVLFVGVRCPLDVLERREQERTERIPGIAAINHERVHARGLYDLKVDTSKLSPMDCALEIKQRLADGPAPTAFAQLRDRMARH